MATVVVILGAYTRLVDAGLGCPDWPTCYGHLWVPTTAIDISSANEKFADTPVETDKTWPEQIHRIFASSLGLVILLLFILAYKSLPVNKESRITAVLLMLLVGVTVVRIRVGESMDMFLLLAALLYFGFVLSQKYSGNSSEKPFKLVAFLSGFVILQGWFGMWTVTLKLWPQVVTAHLLGGFTTLALLWLLLQKSAGYKWILEDGLNKGLDALRPIAWLAIIVVFLQIALGGWTTSNYAALACPDFPTCHASWWPAGDFAAGFNFLQQLGPNYLGGQLDNHARTAIHLSHRIGAVFVFLVVLFTVIRLLCIGSRSVTKMAFVLLALLILQLILGITNVLGGLPLMVAVAHNAVGAALLLCCTTLLHRLYGAQYEQIYRAPAN